MNPRVEPATVTSLGSLPHDDPAEAVAAVMRATPALPAAPQLSAQDPAETMLGQIAPAIGGAEAGFGGFTVARPDDVSAVEVEPTGRGWSGFDAFLDAIRGRNLPVKIQLAGPVTVALALARAGVEPRRAAAVAGDAIGHLARRMAARVAKVAPGAPIVAFLDEPSLVALTRPDFPLPIDEVVDLLATGLAAFGTPDTGVHVCGATDWHVIAAAGPAVLSLPVEPLGESGTAVAAHLEAGGWVAWGAVPTHRPIGTSPDPQWRQLVELWCELTQNGCDPVQLRRQSLITPECGLAGHGISQAERVLDLAASIGERVHSQAVAARLSVGA